MNLAIHRCNSNVKWINSTHWLCAQNWLLLGHWALILKTVTLDVSLRAILAIIILNFFVAQILHFSIVSQ